MLLRKLLRGIRVSEAGGENHLGSLLNHPFHYGFHLSGLRDVLSVQYLHIRVLLHEELATFIGGLVVSQVLLRAHKDETNLQCLSIRQRHGRVGVLGSSLGRAGAYGILKDPGEPRRRASAKVFGGRNVSNWSHSGSRRRSGRRGGSGGRGGSGIFTSARDRQYQD